MIEYVGGPLDGQTYAPDGPSHDRPFTDGYYGAAMNSRRYWRQEFVPPKPKPHDPNCWDATDDAN